MLCPLLKSVILDATFLVTKFQLIFQEKCLRTFRFPPDITFVSHIYQKDISVVSNVDVAAIFTQHAVPNCSQLVTLRHVRTND